MIWTSLFITLLRHYGHCHVDFGKSDQQSVEQLITKENCYCVIRYLVHLVRLGCF